VLIDEAHRLKPEALEVIRDLHETVSASVPRTRSIARIIAPKHMRKRRGIAIKQRQMNRR